MAVEWDVEFKRSSLYQFKPQDIDIRPEFCGRHERPNEQKIRWLMDQFKTVGQRQPCIIWRDGAQCKRPILLAGHRRWEAATRLWQEGTQILLDCVYFKGNAKEAFEATLEENIREETTPIDDAFNIQSLQRQGRSIPEIAKFFGEDEAWVRARLALITLSEEGREALLQGKLKITAAGKLAKLSEEAQRARIASAGGKRIKVSDVEVGTGKPTAKDLRKALALVADEGRFPVSLSGVTITDEVRDFAAHLQEWLSGKLGTEATGAAA